MISFFRIADTCLVDTCLNCEDTARQSCAMVPRWRLFGDFLSPVFLSNPHAVHFRPAFKIRTKATPCVEVWQTSNLRRLRSGEEKKKKQKKEEGKKQQGKNIMVCPIP